MEFVKLQYNHLKMIKKKKDVESFVSDLKKSFKINSKILYSLQLSTFHNGFFMEEISIYIKRTINTMR